MDGIILVQVRNRWRTDVNAEMNLRVLLNEGNFLISCGTVSFSIRSVLRGVSQLISVVEEYLLRHWVMIVPNNVSR